MTPDTIFAIGSLVFLVACRVGYRYLSDNVKLTYKDQRIPEVRK